MAKIHRGDQYGIRFELKEKSGAVIRDTDADQVLITINGTEKSYPGGGVTFADGKWVYPMTEEESKAYPRTVKWQVKVVIGDDKIQTDGETETIGETFFREDD